MCLEFGPHFLYQATLSVYLDDLFFANIFYYLGYFYYYLWTPLHFSILFINLTVLFQLIFTFIYNTFSKSFQF